MANPVLMLDAPAAREAAIAGGKGAALAQMIRAKLPVPGGFVVTTHAFAQSAKALLPEIARLFEGTAADDLTSLERAGREAAKRITSHRPHTSVVEAIHSAYQKLGSPPVAVRSSATAEDLPTASFAGQYDSFLNVTDAESVLQRILDVWASLYSAHAVAYRRRQGLDGDAVRMAVIVQRQLPADAAGVLFTRDPVSGSAEEFVVSAAFGLGEGVVDGSASSDRFGLHPVTGAVLSRDVVQKEHMVTLAEQGSLRVDIKPSLRAEPALSDSHLSELGGLARSVRELFGGHQDVEFAVVGDSVHLLQARPVTGVGDEQVSEFPVEWENPDDANYTWQLRAMGQRAVLPARRLEEDAQRAYSEGSRICFAETGSPMALAHIVRFINGYCYVRPPEVNQEEVTKRMKRAAKIAEAHDARGTTLWDAELRPQVEQVLQKLGRFRRRGASLAALVEHLEDAIQAFAHVHGDLHWRLAAGGEALREDWPTIYHELTGEPKVDAGAFLQAVENKTTRMVRWLRDLARMVQQDRALTDIFEARDYGRLDQLGNNEPPAVRRFQRRFRNLLRRHGRRTGYGFGSATSFATPTWGMEPRMPLDLIRSYAEQDLDEMERMEDEARQERVRATRRVRRMLAGDADGLARFERSLWRAQNGVRMMENHNHMMEQATGGARREAVYWVGQRLVSDGLLDAPDDVLNISLEELRQIAAGAGPEDLRPLVRERNDEFERRSRLEPPKTIGSGGPQLPDMERRFDPPPGTGRDGALLRGVAASRGRATGPARVAPPSAEPPAVRKGDILVAQNAGPNWTPIFPLLGGLVLDAGVVFQHAALVAREYGIPAVLMTREGTTTISDGDMITVDGDEGVVELTS